MPASFLSASSDTTANSRKNASQKQASVVRGCRSKTDGPRMIALIELEGVFVVLLQRRVLSFLPQKAVADRERLDLRAHEAAERVLGRADDRLAAHVEAGVDDHRAAGQVFIFGNQFV